MNAEEIRERRRQRILARANAQKNQQLQPTQQPESSSKPTEQQKTPLVHKLVEELQQKSEPTSTPSAKPEQEQKQKPSNIRQHVQIVLKRKKYKKILLEVTKVIGIVLGLLSTSDNSSYDWLVILVAFLLFAGFTRVFIPTSDIENAKQNGQTKRTQMQTINDIFSGLGFLLQHLKIMSSIVCSYLLTIFAKSELGYY